MMLRFFKSWSTDVEGVITKHDVDLESELSFSFKSRLANIFKSIKEGRFWNMDFPIGSSTWKLGFDTGGVGGKGNEDQDLLLYVAAVAGNDEQLPEGWYREAYFKLTLSTVAGCPGFEMRAVFTKEESRQSCKVGTISEFAGYLVNDTIEFQTTAVVIKAFPTVIGDDTFNGKKKLERCLLDLERFLERVLPSSSKEEAAPKAPSSEEVKKAKQSLKECLSDLFSSNIRVKLAKALSTLSLAEGEMLSSEQHHCVQHYKANFEELISDYLIFHKVNMEYEMRRHGRASRISAIKKYHDNHVRYEKALDRLIRKGDQVKEQIKELNRRRNKKKIKTGEEELIMELERVESDQMILAVKMEAVVAYTRDAKSSYDAMLEELAVEEEKKRSAEEQFSRSSPAWDCLKQHFG